MWIWVVSFVIVTLATVPFILGSRFPALSQILEKRKEAVIVFAHPDDETMFFVPLISYFHRIGLRFKLLCLSTGNYEGLGEIRVKEIQTVGRALGARSTTVVDEPGLQDGPHAWTPAAVKFAVNAYLAKNPSVDTIFTFDSYGVSGHINHISVFKGIASMTFSSGISLFSLKSVPMWRKYLPFVDFLYLLALTPSSKPLLAVNTDDPFKSLRVMKLYGSQNVWFRKLFSVFSRYSYVNEFVRI